MLVHRRITAVWPLDSSRSPPLGRPSPGASCRLGHRGRAHLAEGIGWDALSTGYRPGIVLFPVTDGATHCSGVAVVSHTAELGSHLLVAFP